MERTPQNTCLIPPHEMQGVQRAQVGFSPLDFGEAVRGAALRAGFRQAHFNSRVSDGSFTGRRRLELANLRSASDTVLLVRWMAMSTGQTHAEWAAATQHGQTPPVADLASRAAFEHWLGGEITALLDRPRPAPSLIDPVVRPGQRPPLRYSGQLYDYSALATSEQVALCRTGTLPLGREAFGWPTTGVTHGAPLFLPLAGGRPREELGVLVCAPQGSGKTHLLLEWAAAAAQAGRSVFLVDVKGNMRGELEAAFARAGVRTPIWHFTTAPHEACHAINLLAGISAGDIDSPEQLLRLAEALLPAAPAQGAAGQPLWKEVAVRVLWAAMRVLKLIEYYGHLDGEPGRTADLTDLNRLVATEGSLVTMLDFLRRYETWAREANAPLARYSVEECISTLAITLGNHDITVTADDGTMTISPFHDGQRPPDQTYFQYMIPILTALEPFRPSGFMAERVRSKDPDQEIRLDRFGREGAARVIILSAREQDSALAKAFLAMAMRRLRHALDERRNLPRDELGEVLLLLDETRRIEGFDAAEFVSIVRQNQVGYVLVYQSLAMIGQPDQIGILMRNIGTQIFLSGIAGQDLEIFNRQMPSRDVVRGLASEQSSPSSGQMRGMAQQNREVPFLQANAAHALPAGRFPALIHLQGGPPPFLVDFDAAQSGSEGP